MRIRRGLAALATAATVVSGFVGMASAAHATSTPPWEPDGNNIGTISFYNSSGIQVTSGSDLTHLFDYALASAAVPGGVNATRASLYLAVPKSATPTGNWYRQLVSTATPFPDSSAPAPLNTATTPLVALGSTDGNASAVLQSSTQDTTAGYANILEVRMAYSGPGGVTSGNSTYYTADISYTITNTNNDTGTWTELWPIDASQQATTTTTSLAVQTTSPNSVTPDLLSAEVTPQGAAGTVNFVDTSNGNNVLGSGTVNSSGLATASVAIPVGSHVIEADFVPTNSNAYAASQSSTLTVVSADPAGGYAPITPARILDTRSGTGAARATVAAGHSITLTVAGVGGVPSTGAASALMNITVLGTTSTGSGYLTVYPAGTTQPHTSNVNYKGTTPVPNSVVATLGSSGANAGKIVIYNGGNVAVNIIGDVSGVFFAGSGSNGYYHPLATSARLLDTRVGTGATKGAVPAHGTVTFPVASQAGLPATLAGVVMNITAVSASASGTVTAYAAGTSTPTVTSVAFPASSVEPATAGLDVVGVGSNGSVTIKNNTSGAVQLIADVSGYWVSGSGSGSLSVLAPPVREESSLVIPAQSSETVTFASTTAAAALTLTVLNAGASGYLTAYPSSASRPGVSLVNFVAHTPTSNLTFVSAGPTHAVTIYNSATVPVTVQVDAEGFFQQ